MIWQSRGHTGLTVHRDGSVYSSSMDTTVTTHGDMTAKPAPWASDRPLALVIDALEEGEDGIERTMDRASAHLAVGAKTVPGWEDGFPRIYLAEAAAWEALAEWCHQQAAESVRYALSIGDASWADVALALGCESPDAAVRRFSPQDPNRQ